MNGRSVLERMMAIETKHSKSRHRRVAAFILGGLMLGLGACAPIQPFDRGYLYPVGTPPWGGPAGGPPQASRTLRVLLAAGKGALKVSCPGGLTLSDEQGGGVVARLGSGSTSLGVAQGRFLWKGRFLAARSLLIRPARPGDSVEVSGRHYRGRLCVRLGGDGRLLLVNEVPLESYLLSVLPSEIPPSWPMEALKAQAVAARTYALFRASTSPSPDFDLDDTTRSQMYTGTRLESPRCRQAVAETEGQVVTWQGRLAETFFCSNCGGHTADVAGVWGGRDLPYLAGVPCHFGDRGRHFFWQGDISVARAQARLRAKGALKGALLDLQPFDQDDSGRWRKVRVRGSGGDVVISSSELRGILGVDLLRSTRFEVERVGDTFSFQGRGWGHGVGLCQEGAKGMAEQGYGYRQILAYYYPGTSIQRIR